jgi:ABC-type lipoprotein export system ATPase subunit
MGMDEFGDRLPSELSLGQRQRTAIVAAVAQEPRVFLADEPTGSLDSDNSRRVAEILWKVASRGVIVLVGTHDQQMMGACDAILRIEEVRS